MRHHKKTHKKLGGSFFEEYFTGPLSRLTGTTPASPQKVIEKPTKVATQAVEKSAEVVNIPTSSSPEGTPGLDTPVAEAEMLGGRRRKSRKTRKHRRRRSKH